MHRLLAVLLLAWFLAIRALNVCVVWCGTLRYSGVGAGDVWLNPAFSESRALQDVHFLLLGHLFGLGYRRVERRVDAADTDARTHLPAAGFHLEGVLRKHMIVKVQLMIFVHDAAVAAAAAAAAAAACFSCHERPLTKGRTG